MAELTYFEASDSFRTFPAQRTTYRANEPMDGQIASSEYIGARDAGPSLLADLGSPPSGSFLSLLQANYAIWESSLADSRSLVDVNGVSVYPECLFIRFYESILQAGIYPSRSTCRPFAVATLGDE